MLSDLDSGHGSNQDLDQPISLEVHPEPDLEGPDKRTGLPESYNGWDSGRLNFQGVRVSFQ